MTQTWNDQDAPGLAPIGPMGWLRAVLRAIPLAVLVFGCLLLLLAVRVVEKPLFGLGRPWTPYITQFVCRNAFRILGVRYHRIGAPMMGAGAVVANHSSWLDIFALNAAKRIYFVSKEEVASWPGIGWLARATGTVFIKRDRTQATAQIEVFRARLAAGHKLLFFPEGTSTDGQQVLDFKPTLFAAFFDPALRDQMQIQPVTLIYRAPEGCDPRTYGWWGDMDFGPHLLATLAAAKQGSVTVHYHPAMKLTDYPDRKAVARATQKMVSSALTDALQRPAP